MGERGNRMKQKTEQIKRAVGYVRVSTDEQTKSGLSLESQRDRIEAYAKVRGLELAEIVTDASVSGGTPLAKRPGGAEVSELVRRRRVSAVVVIKLDRLFRDTADALATVGDWDRRDVGLHVLDLGGSAVDTQSASGRFMLTVLAAIGEMERGQVRERTAAALERKRVRGEKTGGGIPYGYRVTGGRILPDADEQRIAKRMQGLRARGYTLRKVADRLNRDGLRTKRGASWKAVQVARALRNAERFAVAV
jgi:site-specific DNA recombinase